MNAFLAAFRLEIVSFARSKALFLLLAASLLWMVAAPFWIEGDGTLDGFRELLVRYSLGGVFALLAVALLASATGAFAREREAHRLNLTLVRPIRHATLALAKICALTCLGAVVLAVACLSVCLYPSVALDRPARHLVSPILPSVREEAVQAYEAFLKDPRTPEAVRRAKRSAVVRLLEQRAFDRYESVRTNGTVSLSFPTIAARGEDLLLRVRFEGLFNARQDVRGVFRLGDYEGVLTNVTQASLEIPLHAVSGGVPSTELTFRNESPRTLMFRPRRDIQLLSPGGTFAQNLGASFVELLSLLALVVGFGVFLSSALSRPVALFVALVLLVVGEISPSVIETTSDDLEAGLVDRVSLELTRVSASLTRPLSAVDPISRLSRDVKIETPELVCVVLVDALLAPLLFALLAGGVAFARPEP